MSYPEEEHLEQHLVAHKAVKRRFICDICKKAFKLKHHLTNHKFCHNTDRPFTCSTCKKDFKTRDHLRAHSGIHKPKTNICEECGKGFHRKYNLKLHAKTHINQWESVHIATALDGPTSFCCPKSCPEKELFEKHLVAHKAVERQFICDVCKKAFKLKHHLTNHKFCHNTDRPFKCSACKKDFKTREHLRVHSGIHKPKANICEECGKGFHRKYNLKLHTKTHKNQWENANLQQQGPLGDKPEAKDTKAHQQKTEAKPDEIEEFGCKQQYRIPDPFNVKITSWRIDGIREWIKKGGINILKYDNLDILCLQGTRCRNDKLPAEVKGIEGYHDYWYSRDKEGYAGVGVYTKKKPLNVKEGIENDPHDIEGSCLTLEFTEFYLVNVYVPNADISLKQKPKWKEAFDAHLEKLHNNKTKKVLLAYNMVARVTTSGVEGIY